MNQSTLSRKHYEILAFIEGQKEKMTQREIAKEMGLSVGTISKILTELSGAGLLKDKEITKKGYEALEPFRVKRAIFIAAGFGSRLVPITLNTPKPLVRVNGVRMIDTLLDAVLAAGIEDIYIVRGYLGEQFDQLLYKYPMIRFIDNPFYNEANNISSTMFVRDLLQNAYVLEADLVLSNPKLIRKYQFVSNYLGVYTDKTDDWCLETNHRTVTKVKIGGENCYHMYGISFWTEEDGKKLFDDIKTVYEMPGGKERYWDQVPLEYCLSHYHVEVRPCTFADIVEIDSYSDLKRLDPTYC